MTYDLTGPVSTLLHSWGHDTPPEVYWGLNEMLQILYQNSNYTPIFFEEQKDYTDEEFDAIVAQFNFTI